MEKPSMTVYFASFGALLGALSMGLALGYTAPAFLDMVKDSQTPILDPNEGEREKQKSLIASMLAVGALFGGFLGEPCNKILGRRLSLVSYGVPFVIGWILLATATGIPMLVMGRLLTGLCCGLVSGTAPTYVVEIAPPQIRGLLGTCFQVMVVIGILLAAILGLFLSWQALAGASLFASVGMSIIMLFMPETPQWLLSKSRNEEAEQSLCRLRTSPVAQELSTMLESAQNAQQSSSQYSMETLKSREFYKPFILALGLMFFQQFSGVNAVLFYQSDIFKKVSESSDALQSTIFVCLAQVIATMLGSFLVDSLGRKILLFASGVGHAISLVVLGAYFSLSQNSNDFQTNYGWMALVALIVFISSFSLGFGPVPWMMIPELSSARVRSLVASIATAFNWACVYVVTASVKSLTVSLGDDWTYWMFAFICLASCCFVIYALPETKGKSPEQIQTELLGTNPQQTGQREEPLKTMA